MTGDSCLARAVALRAAAAVDHADTELIGHRGWEGTGFLCGGGDMERLVVCQCGLAAGNATSCQAQDAGYTYEPSPILALNPILLYNDKRIRPMGIIKKWSFL